MCSLSMELVERGKPHLFEMLWILLLPSAKTNRVVAARTNRVVAVGGLLSAHPKLREWIRGVDAAANELHTEVFGPLFRVAREAGIEHATFHVGEDFFHLLSGIRQIDDTLNFLQLRRGDRLGHCTAIGIVPEYWAASMPAKILIKKEDWMNDMRISQYKRMEEHHCYRWLHLDQVKVEIPR